MSASLIIQALDNNKKKTASWICTFLFELFSLRIQFNQTIRPINNHGLLCNIRGVIMGITAWPTKTLKDKLTLSHAVLTNTAPCTACTCHSAVQYTSDIIIHRINDCNVINTEFLGGDIDIEWIFMQVAWSSFPHCTWLYVWFTP